MFERDFPGHDTTGWNDKAEIGDLPIEMCDHDQQIAWGYNEGDDPLQEPRRRSCTCS